MPAGVGSSASEPSFPPPEPLPCCASLSPPTSAESLSASGSSIGSPFSSTSIASRPALVSKNACSLSSFT